MSLPLVTTYSGRLEELSAFTLRVRPILDARLARVVEDVPRELGPVRGAVSRALGLEARAGRRWRPLLTLAVCEALTGRAEDAVDAAVAVELTHTASLVLDDMPCMDDSPLRRGEPATHSFLGSAGAILLAVGLLAQAAELLGGGPQGGALSERWGHVFGLRGMAGGQAVDLAMSGQSTGAFRRLYRQKTSALVELSAEAGGAVVGATPETMAGLRAFGRDLGWAYQLIDDAHDLEQDRALGRAPGGRNPVRQASRLLDRAVRQLYALDGYAEGGRDLLEGLSRDVVRIPPLSTVTPDPGVLPC